MPQIPNKNENYCKIEPNYESNEEYIKSEILAVSFQLETECQERKLDEFAIKDPLDTSIETLKPFQCLECKLRFKYKRALVAHTTHVHEGKMLVLKCDICDKEFNGKNYLKKHI